MRRWTEAGKEDVQVSIERLRRWLLLGAGMLVAVLAGFLGYAHFGAHRLLKDLPGRLGAEISREANGFTYSQSNGKRTLYTIHAARFIQRKNNVVSLRDVGIVLYDNAGRADRIYGKEFEYDQTSGVLRSTGEVFLDLAAPAPTDSRGRAAYASGSTSAAVPNTSDPNVIHVHTRDVVFAQRQGLASTDQDLDFTYGAVKGSGTGADFHSDTGATVLRSHVHLTSSRSGRPDNLTADRAELNRQQQTVDLERAQVSTTDSHGQRETASALHATVLLRTAATPERIHAEGSVVVSGRSSNVRADRGAMVLGSSDQPESADLQGNVYLVADQASRHLEASAAEAHTHFVAAGAPDRVRLSGGAIAQEHESVASAAQSTAADRSLTAQQIDLSLADAGRGQRWLRDVTATGAAHFVSHQPTAVVTSHPLQRTDEMAADLLVAHLRQSTGPSSAHREDLASVDGQGHTSVHQTTSDGADTQTFGDTLHASFLPSTVAASRQAQTLQMAEQVGHIRIAQRSSAKPGELPTLSSGTADHLTFDGPSQQANLLGHVQLNQTGSVLWADQVTLDQATGDATAAGSVKLSYRAPTATTTDPVQVLSAQAHLQHSSGIATFYGTAAHPARMWQAGSAIEAPVLELHQHEQTLSAHAAPGAHDTAPAVRTVLAGTPTKRSDNAAKHPPTQALRVLSRDLVYAESSRTAVFSGGVDVTEADTEVHGAESTVYLQPKAPSSTPTAPTAPFPGAGSLDRIVTTGSVRVGQPGREATGDRLVYTATDRVSVLTGTPGKPPIVTDDQSGTVSGSSIRFLPGDNGQSTVVVSGGGSSQPKLRTETRGKQP